MTIGFPLDPTLAKAFLFYHKKHWIERCRLKYRQFFYQRYVDDMIVLFNSSEHQKHIHGYSNSPQDNIKKAM